MQDLTAELDQWNPGQHPRAEDGTIKCHEQDQSMIYYTDERARDEDFYFTADVLDQDLTRTGDLSFTTKVPGKKGWPIGA